MGNNTQIQWADHTVNFWTGCTKVSEGCKYCYMYREMENRFKKDASILRPVKESTWRKVLRESKPGDRIFVNSWSDFFIDAPEIADVRKNAWKVMAEYSDRVFMLLTKRAEDIHGFIPMMGVPDNVWIGVTVESQQYVDKRLLYLVDLDCIRFVSIEPMLGPVALGEYLNVLDWVIVGGESGNETGKYRYRECRLDWMERLVQECGDAAVPVFVKQVGTHISKGMGLKDRHGGNVFEFPKYLQYRQLPRCTNNGLKNFI